MLYFNEFPDISYRFGDEVDATVFQDISIFAEVIDTVKVLEEKLSHIKTPITLSIIGCVVNGPGEAALTDIGITGGGKGNNMLYLSGIQTERVLTSEIINKVVSEVEKKAAEIEKNKR